MSDLTYCFVDVEVDGPDPGSNSMLSFACVAHHEDGPLIAEFEANLRVLPGACPEAETAEWWQSQPDAWAAIRANAVDPAAALHGFVEWLTALPGDKAFAAHPLLLDAPWIDWYLRRFTGTRLFAGPFRGRSLFVGAGLDLPSYAQAALRLPYAKRRPHYPDAVIEGVRHTHRPLDDARGHAAVFFNIQRLAGDGPT